MPRRLVLIALLFALGFLATVLGPVAVEFLTELPVEYRAMRELARQEEYRKQHPPEQFLSRRKPQVILRAAAARSIQVYRLNPVPDGGCSEAADSECFEGHRILRRIPVDGTEWSHRFLIHVMRMATVSRRAEEIRPRFGVRFIGAKDTTTLLLDTTDTTRVAVLVFGWRAPSGHTRRVVAHMAYPFEHPDADTTLQLLQFTPRL